jgi:hypothetical protein
MGGFGGLNPYPFQYGGGPTDVEKIWRALRAALGVDLSGKPVAGPEDGLEDSWRKAKAKALAAAGAVFERAVLQGFPGVATDYLGEWETILGLPGTEPTDHERRLAAAAAYAFRPRSDCPGLTESVQRIDAALAADASLQWDQFRVAEPGKPFEPLFGFPQYGLRESSQLPLFSDGFFVRVRSTEAFIDEDTMRSVLRHLDDVIPAWCDRDVYADGPCYADGGADGTSLADMTSIDG